MSEMYELACPEGRNEPWAGEKRVKPVAAGQVSENTVFSAPDSPCDVAKEGWTGGVCSPDRWKEPLMHIKALRSTM